MAAIVTEVMQRLQSHHLDDTIVQATLAGFIDRYLQSRGRRMTPPSLQQIFVEYSDNQPARLDSEIVQMALANFMEKSLRRHGIVLSPMELQRAFAMYVTSVEEHLSQAMAMTLHGSH